MEYLNNIKCVELIEKKPLGIMALIDEECIVPNGSDSNLISKINDRLKTNPHLVAQVCQAFVGTDRFLARLQKIK